MPVFILVSGTGWLAAFLTFADYNVYDSSEFLVAVAFPGILDKLDAHNILGQ